MWLRRRPSTSAAAAILVLAMLVGGLAWRAAAARHQRRIDLALIDSIASADLRALPTMLGSLSARGDDSNTRQLIRASLANLHPPDPRWVNLCLAASALGSGPAGDALLDYLPQARPGELSLLVSRLAEHKEPLPDSAWEKLAAPEIKDRGKLNLACLVARTAPDDLRWSGITPSVAAALIEVHPIDIGAYTNMLMPARKQLVASLADAYRQRVSNDPLRREVVAGLLSRLAADEPARLADLLVDADQHEFSLFVEAIQSQKELAKPPLHRAAATRTMFAALAANKPWETRHAVVQTYDASERRRATAMIALWRLGERDVALHALRDGSEPALESWLVELLAPLGVAAGELVDEVHAAEGAGLRKSLLLALGNLDLEGLPEARRVQISEAVRRLYKDDPDPGVHSACEQLLAKHLNVDPPSVDARRDEKPSATRRWFNGPNDHTFAVLDSADYTMGAPLDEMTREEDETPHLVRIGHNYAIATKETSVGQFLRCRDDYFNRRYSASDDCPANNISWYDAAAYCRWLSELEGVAENQMCFPPRDEIGPGMKLPENWIARTGYRLPTESEWEYACRGGTTTSRYCGEGKALLPRYAWFVENSDDHAWPVGRLLPNRFGLFDMMGNVTERCFDEYGLYPAKAENGAAAPRGARAPVNGASLRVFRGGNFGDAEHNLRSARRYANAATDEWALVGFRVARTMPGGDR
jgi:formylglycine-generating enzyme required for sulfatase activity